MRIRSVLSSVGLASPEHDQRTRSNLFTRDLHLRAETLNEEARTVEAVVATENMALSLSLHGYSLVLEVYLADGFEQPKTKQVPLLDNHMRYSTETIRGSVRDLKVRGRDVVGTLHFGQSEKSENDWMNVRDGHLTDVSGGFRPIKTVEIMPGKSKNIKGRTYTAPEDRKLYVHTRWTLGEVSLTPIGADEDSKIRESTDGRVPANNERIVDMKLNEHVRAYLEAHGLDKNADDAAAREFLSKLPESQRTFCEGLGKPASNGDKSADQQTTDTTNDKARTNASDDQKQTKQVSTIGADTSTIDAEKVRRETLEADKVRRDAIQKLPGIDQYPELLRSLLDDPNITEESASLRLLNHERALRMPGVGGAPAAHTRQQGVSEQTRAITAALSLRSGVDMDHLVVRGASDPAKARELAANQSEKYSRMSLFDLCRTCLQIEGRSIPHTQEELIRAAGSTSVFNYAFTDSINAGVDQSFDDAPDSTFWCEETEVADFKTNTDITLNKTSGIKKHTRGGTAEDVESGDEAETYKIARYSGKWTMDEMDIIDDNMGIFADIREEMGGEAAQLRPRLVYAILLANPTLLADGVALFHTASHGNLASDALSISAVETGVTAIAKQTKNGRPLNTKAKYLICCQDLKHSAKIIAGSQTVVIAGTAGSVTTRGVDNAVSSDDLQVVADSYLGAAGVTDPSTGIAHVGSATNWFLAGARRTIRVAYRRGTNKKPVVRSYTLNQGMWGMGWDINLDIGAYARDFRNLYKGNA